MNIDNNTRLDLLEKEMDCVKSDVKTMAGRMSSMESLFTSIIESQGQIKEKLQDIVTGKTYICGQQQQKLSNAISQSEEFRKANDTRIGRLEGVGISLSLTIIGALVTLFVSVFKQ